MTTLWVGLSQITVDERVQVREALDEATVERYRELLDGLPPVELVLVSEGELKGKLVLSAGFHRYEAARRNERAAIRATITPGTLLDAKVLAASRDGQHGLPLKPKERETAVLRIEDWVDAQPDLAATRKTWTVARIASVVGCGESTVSKILGRHGRLRQPQAHPNAGRVEISTFTDVDDVDNDDVGPDADEAWFDESHFTDPGPEWVNPEAIPEDRLSLRPGQGEGVLTLDETPEPRLGSVIDDAVQSAMTDLWHDIPYQCEEALDRITRFLRRDPEDVQRGLTMAQQREYARRFEAVAEGAARLAAVLSDDVAQMEVVR